MSLSTTSSTCLPDITGFQSQLLAATNNRSARYNDFTTTWVDSPTFRGTASILWTCLITLGACVYTVLHLNISLQHRTTWQNILAKAKWVALTTIAPELTLSTALQQYRDARRLVNGLREIQKDQNPGVNAGEGRNSIVVSKFTSGQGLDFNMAYGFWVVMGGFVVSTDSISEEYKKVTLTADGVLLLARNGRYLEIADEHIADRSKANILAKFVVCVQVTWMVIQCIERAVRGIPLALLEIHTMVHVVCALIIYSLWWHKPLDVQEPEHVDLSAHMDLVALMFIGCSPSRTRDWGSHLQDLYIYQIDPRADIKQHEQGAEETGAPGHIEEPINSVESANPERPHSYRIKPLKVVSSMTEAGTLKIKPGEALEFGLGLFVAPEFDLDGFVELNEKDIRSWKLALGPLRELASSPEYSSGLPYHFENSPYKDCDKGVLIQGTRNMNRHTSVHGKSELDSIVTAVYNDGALITLLALVPIFYGGIHLLAWNFPFPTTAESILWRTSGIAIMVILPLQTIAVILLTFLELNDKQIQAVYVLFLIVLTVARFYLVLESFLSLRKSPIGVFMTTPWLQNVPHL